MKPFFICGHGDGDPGACGNEYQEAERVRALVKRIKHFGGDAVIVGDTTKDWYKSNLVNNTNIPKGSLVTELHMDWWSDPEPRGAHVVIKEGFRADKYDEALADFLVGVLPGRADSIVERNNLANVNRAAEAGINYRLVECGFISNVGDVQIFNSRMDEIAKGILRCFDIKPIEEKKEEVKTNNADKLYRVYEQKEAFSMKENAEKLQKELQAAGKIAIIVY